MTSQTAFLLSTVLLLLAGAIVPLQAFVVTTTTTTTTSSSTTTPRRSGGASPIRLDATTLELTPEPSGGQELTSLKTMDGSRMKNMGVVDGIKSEGTVYKFWLTARAEGALIKDIHTRILKDAAKKANFPGFRKGQVPPYAMPQIRGFSVQEGIIQTCQSAVDAYGLKSLSGSDGEVEVLEDVPEMANNYKVGDDILFTASFNAIYDPEMAKSAVDAVADVLDVEATSIEAEAETVE